MRTVHDGLTTLSPLGVRRVTCIVVVMVVMVVVVAVLMETAFREARRAEGLALYV